MATSRLLPAVALLVLCACTGPGRIYTDQTVPLTSDFAATPVGNKVCVLDEHHVQEPFSRAGVSVDWTSDVIRRAMSEAGMNRAYYAEQRTFSLLGGIYRRTSVVIHGD